MHGAEPARAAAAAKRPPFCHVFEADGRHFAYDVHTHGLLEVEPVLAAVLPRYGVAPRRELVRELGPRFGAAAVREAFAAIERGRRERGVFLARRPRLVPPPAAQAAPGVCDRDLEHLVLTVTERCNLRCRYCTHGAGLDWVRPHRDVSLPEETARRAIAWFLDRARRDEAPVISFYGGEALLEVDRLEAYVATARAHPRGAEVRFALDTNGVLLDDRAVELAVRERMLLQVSLDGPASEHDRHRVDAGGAPTHARLEAGLDRLLARDPTAAGRMVFVATLAPPVDVGAVARYFAEFPPFRRRGLEQTPLVRVNRADLRGQDWAATDADHAALRAALEAERERYLSRLAGGRRDAAGPVAAALCEPVLIRWHHRSRAFLGRAWTPGGNCRPGRRKLHVMPDGTFHACERSGDLLPIGDIQRGIDPAAVRGLQQGFHVAAGADCADCWALRLCGLCFAAHAASGGRAGLGRPFPAELCLAERRAQEGALRLVARVLQLPAETRNWLDATSLG
jgi:uncharacterized protein